MYKNIWRKPTPMYTKNLVVYDNRQRQEIEHICKIRPNMCGTILSDTFRVEAIRLLVNLSVSISGK